MSHCNAKTEVYSRIVGYFRPVQQWNLGKKEEYFHRRTYVASATASEIVEFPLLDEAKTTELAATAT